MGQMGRPPKPTQLKILHGNPGRRPLPPGEPKPPARMPARPQWLLPEAKREWRRLAPMLVRLGILTEIDRMPFAMLCQAWARYKRAEQKLSIMEATGAFLVDLRRQGMISHARFAEVTALAGRFGLTASDRVRLALPEAKQEDPFDAFLGRKANGE